MPAKGTQQAVACVVCVFCTRSVVCSCLATAHFSEVRRGSILKIVSAGGCRTAFLQKWSFSDTLMSRRLCFFIVVFLTSDNEMHYSLDQLVIRSFLRDWQEKKTLCGFSSHDMPLATYLEDDRLTHYTWSVVDVLVWCSDSVVWTRHRVVQWVYNRMKELIKPSWNSVFVFFFLIY